MLLDSAASSSDSRVSRIVDAHAAVDAVLGATPPLVDVTAPAPGAAIAYGRSFRIAATALDDEGGCCLFAWTDSQDGLLSNSQTANVVLGSPGTHTITVVATDASGATGQDQVTVQATNQPPSASILDPAAGATVFRNVVTTLHGTATDPNQPFLPCERLSWASSDPGDTGFPATGCQPAVTFTSNGPRTLTLTATDDVGATATTTAAVTVADPPDAHPPIVTITDPDEGQILNVGETYTLQAAIAQAEGGGTATYRWVARQPDGQETQIGTTNPMSWRPHDTYPGGCEGDLPIDLRLEVTDAWGAGSDTVAVRVLYPIC